MARVIQAEDKIPSLIKKLSSSLSNTLNSCQNSKQTGINIKYLYIIPLFFDCQSAIDIYIISNIPLKL